MPDQIRIRGRIYERYVVRGRVTALRSSGTAGPGVALMRCLRDRRGRDFRIPIEVGGARTGEGHDLTAVWLVRDDRTSGPYVAVHNHTTAETWHNDRVLARLHRPTWLVMTGLGAGAVGGLASAGWALVLVLVLAGSLGWWIGGVAGRRRLKASGALLTGAGESTLRGNERDPSSTTSRGSI